MVLLEESTINSEEVKTKSMMETIAATRHHRGTPDGDDGLAAVGQTGVVIGSLPSSRRFIRASFDYARFVPCIAAITRGPRERWLRQSTRREMPKTAISNHLTATANCQGQFWWGCLHSTAGFLNHVSMEQHLVAQTARCVRFWLPRA